MTAQAQHSYAASKMQTLVLVLLALSVGTPVTAVTGPTPLNTAAYSNNNNWDFPGAQNDISCKSDFLLCLQDCGRLSSCIGITYNQATGQCCSKANSLSPLAAVGRTFYAKNNYGYTAQVNLDVPNNDIKCYFGVANYQNCLSDCNSNGFCKGFNWNAAQRACCYKSSVSVGTPSANIIFFTKNPSAFLMAANYDFIGNDIPNSCVFTGTYQQCLAGCAANPSCQGFNWNSVQRGCCQKQSLTTQSKGVASLTTSFFYAPSFGLQSVVSENMWNQVVLSIPLSCPGKLLYTYEFFKRLMTQYFPEFGTTGTLTVRRLEVAAFLANALHETGDFCQINEECFPNCVYGAYCSGTGGSCPCPNPPNAGYYGRGPLQLSTNSNYCNIGTLLGRDFYTFPNTVAQDFFMSWAASAAFWMTNTGTIGVTCHGVMVTGQGFGKTIQIINAPFECGKLAGSVGNNEMRDRVSRFEHICSLWGLDPGTSRTC